LFDSQAVFCLPKGAPCPDGYYAEYVGEQEENKLLKKMSGKYVCKKCHERCQKCTGYGFHVSVCSECTYVRKGEQVNLCLLVV
jgi:L1 cell adhesion molecule